jgi:hypothetical protein
MNSCLPMPAWLMRSSMPEVSQFRWPTPGFWVSGPTVQFFSSDAAPRAAPPRMSVPAPLPAASVIRLS